MTFLIAGGGSILLKSSLDDYFDQGIEKIVFVDSIEWTRETLRSTLLANASTPGNDMITGFNTADRIDGGPGDDRLDGGSGSDTFIFRDNFGHDTIVGFKVGARSDDVIELHSDVYADFAAVLAAATQFAGDTTLTIDPLNAITLKNVALSSLHPDDFKLMPA